MIAPPPRPPPPPRTRAQLDWERWAPAVVGLEMVNLQAEELRGVLAALVGRGFSVLTDGRDLVALRGPALPPPGDADDPAGGGGESA